MLLSLDLRKYDFCLLTIQAHHIAHDASERHYDLLLKIGHQIVRDMFSEQTPNDHAVVCIHQLMDIFFHHWNDQINPAVERNSSLVIELLEHLGTFDYKGQNLDVDIGLAVYKSFSILGALAPEVQIRLLDNVFLCHFDPEVAKEAQGYKSMVYN